MASIGKWKSTIVTMAVLAVACLCFGVIIRIVCSQMNKLEQLQTSLDGKITKMLATEELIRQFHNDFPAALERKKREAVNLSRTNLGNNWTNSQIENESVISKGGTVYTRWGRSVCETSAELVYEGIVGGGWHDHPGSAVNPLCLVREPKWNKYVDGFQDGVAFLYGTEYKGPSMTNIFSSSNAKTFLSANMPCAVCRTSFRSVSIMVPGRNDCFAGWTLEYEGYLMVGHYNSKMGSQYICVDEAPEATEAGYRDEMGKLFYVVEAVCGSLPCPEYVEGREVTCAVCTI